MRLIFSCRGGMARSGLRIHVLLAVLILSGLDGAGATSAQRAVSEIVIEHQNSDRVTPYATTYRAENHQCAITWIAYDTEFDRGVVKYLSTCSLPLAEQLPLLIDICDTYLHQDRNAPVFRTLFWGRLAPDGGAFHEMSLRLAVAAYHSPDWDRSLGRPKRGDLNRYIRDLANHAAIYPELQQLFATFHRTVTLGHVEKVLVLEAARLPIYPQLEALGVEAVAKLPFDCMAWFAIGTVAE